MKTYVMVGAGNRALGSYARPLVRDYRKEARLAGLYDTNILRAEYLREQTDPQIAIYTDFDLMMRETKPDAAIIVTVDQFHAEYIIRALEYGCDAITEKPMCISEAQCNAILEAEKRTGRKVIVTFNFRYVPYTTRVKELLHQGVVGDILNVDFEYFLDTSHGADYYRRWHRRKENSGGLLVHKSTHHFDLLNWWIGQTPTSVYANGSLQFYGKAGPFRGVRCQSCEYFDTCDFAVKYYENADMQGMYFKPEQEDGYFRDACVFSEEIDIEDTMSLAVKYLGGTLLTYSLSAYSPYEGWKVSITGTKGRIEAGEIHSGREAGKPFNDIRLFQRGMDSTIHVKREDSGHGGGDARLLEDLFGKQRPDPLGHQAGSLAGMASVMIGACANQSIKEGRAVNIKLYGQQ